MRRANLARKARGVAGIIVLLWTGALVSDRSSSEDTPMQVGIDSFAAAFDENSRAVNPAERLRRLVHQIEHARILKNCPRLNTSDIISGSP